MESTRQFNGRARDYIIGRPIYANEFIESLYTRHGFSSDSVIADIGSGTGKFARQLIDKGSFVYCVEPNDHMREKAIDELKKYENCKVIKGTASDTGLKDSSVDYITAAQAFHWFDVLVFLTECKRILKPGGRVFLIWNMRDLSTELNQQCFEIYSQYCPAFKGFAGGIKKDDERLKEFFYDNYQYIEFNHPLSYNRERFISRCLSGSYSLKKGDANYPEYLSRLERLFEQHAKNGILTMENKTVVYYGEV